MEAMVKLERAWCMPRRYTFLMPPVIQLLREEVLPLDGHIVDPFAGLYGHEWANCTNDIDDSMPAQSHEDGLAFLKILSINLNGLVSCVLFDPPYSPEQARRCYHAKYEGIAGLAEYHKECKNEISQLVMVGGIAICFGWNSSGLGRSRGFSLRRGLLICHGGSHRDTIVTVEVKQ